MASVLSWRSRSRGLEVGRCVVGRAGGGTFEVGDVVVELEGGEELRER